MRGGSEIWDWSNQYSPYLYHAVLSVWYDADRVVDELNPELNLTKKEVETLLEFDADADDTPYEDFSNLAEKFSDPMLSNICNDFSNFLSKVSLYSLATGYVNLLIVGRNCG